MPEVTGENGSLVFQDTVGAFFSVHGFGSFAGRATKATDDIGRFDDESR
jgi:hypothetical protein